MDQNKCLTIDVTESYVRDTMKCVLVDKKKTPKRVRRRVKFCKRIVNKAFKLRDGKKSPRKSHSRFLEDEVSHCPICHVTEPWRRSG